MMITTTMVMVVCRCVKDSICTTMTHCSDQSFMCQVPSGPSRPR